MRNAAAQIMDAIRKDGRTLSTRTPKAKVYLFLANVYPCLPHLTDKERAEALYFLAYAKLLTGAYFPHIAELAYQASTMAWENGQVRVYADAKALNLWVRATDRAQLKKDLIDGMQQCKRYAMDRNTPHSVMAHIEELYNRMIHAA